MSLITIDVGVYTPLTVDLTDFDFTGIDKVILTLTNPRSSIKIEREFTTAEQHQIEITPEESLLLVPGAQYDFDIALPNGKKYKNGDNGQIQLRKGCGQWTASE